MASVLFICAAIIVAPPAAAISSEKITALVTPIFLSYRDALAKEASLPPATSDADRLVRLAAIDQAGRTSLSTIKFDGLNEAEKSAARTAMSAEISAHDEADLEALKGLLPNAGWFRISIVGREAAKAAFLIAQHATDLEFQKDVLARMKPLFGTTELDGQLYGLLYDRISLREGRGQTYGTQVACQNGRYLPTDLSDPDHVDERRRLAGFKETEAQYLERFKDEPCH